MVECDPIGIRNFCIMSHDGSGASSEGKAAAMRFWFPQDRQKKSPREKLFRLLKKQKWRQWFLYGVPPATYCISLIDQQVRTASLTSTGKALIVLHDVSLDDVEVLDESQDGARIVREGSEA
jgi:hypothetical protein